MPALGGDLAREAEPVKAEFTAGLRRVVAALSAAGEGLPDERQAAALRQIAMLVGAVVLARACGDPMASEVLQACRE
jgi:TetR/AcrR family transcriptional repressor of nem operon